MSIYTKLYTVMLEVSGMISETTIMNTLTMLWNTFDNFIRVAIVYLQHLISQA